MIVGHNPSDTQKRRIGSRPVRRFCLSYFRFPIVASAYPNHTASIKIPAHHVPPHRAIETVSISTLAFSVSGAYRRFWRLVFPGFRCDKAGGMRGARLPDLASANGRYFGMAGFPCTPRARHGEKHERASHCDRPVFLDSIGFSGVPIGT